jgi:hypothetical protein
MLRKAKVHVLPIHSGDGYGYGGGNILTIGEFAFPFGESPKAAEIAREIERLWNAYGEGRNSGFDGPTGAE